MNKCQYKLSKNNLLSFTSVYSIHKYSTFTFANIGIIQNKRAILSNSGQFRTIQDNSGQFRTIQSNSEQFRAIQDKKGRFLNKKGIKKVY